MKTSYKGRFIKALLLLCIAFGFSADAQTVLISPTAEGGFESGSTFATNGWTVVNNSAGTRSWYVGTGQAGYTGTAAAFIGDNATTVGTVTSTRTVHFYRSVTIPAGATAITLSFDYKQATAHNTVDFLKVYLNGNVPVSGTQQTVGLVATVDPTGSAYANFTNVTVTIPSTFAGATNNLIFSFRADGVSPHGYGAVDNISLSYIPPTCFAPTSLMANTITTNSANLTWTPAGTATNFDLYYGPSPLTAPTAGTTPSASVGTNSYAYTGLSANTNYSYYVRGDCGAGDLSVWVGPYSFKTLCNAIGTFPWTETFEPASATEACWTVINSNADADQWNMDGTTVTAYGGAQQAQLYTDFNAGANDDWLITPAITLTGNQRLKYWYRVRSATEPNDYTIKLSTTGSAPANFTTTVLPLTTASNTVYQENIINLSAYTGTVYLAFHVPSGGLDGWYLYIDDVTVEAIPACPDPIIGTLVPASSTSATLTWTCASCTGSYIVEYGPAGYTPGTGATAGTGGTLASSTATSPYTITGLPAGTVSDVYVRQYCGGTDYSVNTAVRKFIPGDVCANAIDLTALTSPISSTTVGAANDYTNACSGNTSPDLVYSIVVPAYYTLVIGQTVNGYDSENAAYYGGACPGTTQIACYDDPDVQNTTWFNNTGSTQTVYWIQDGYFDMSTAGTFTLAWTLTPPSYDVRALSLASPATAGCYTNSETVSVVIKNEGTGLIDFSTTPVTVNASSTGINPMVFAPVVLTTGTLAPGASQTVIVASGYDMSAPGTYSFSANTSMTGDANTANDAMPAQTRLRTNPMVTTSPDAAICIGASTTLTSGLTPAPPAGIYTNTTDVPVTDNNTTGVTSLINITDLGSISAATVASVRINITHTWDADLDISLISPSGSAIDLTSDNGGSGDNFTNTVFSTTGTAITAGTAPFTGTYTPEQPFSSLTGAANGNWTLKLVDDAGGDVGTLLDWTITFNVPDGIATYSWSPATGLSSTTIANPVANPTSTTTYTVMITDNSGCSATGTTTVTVNSLPVVTATATPSTICVGASTILTGGGAVTYTWDNGATDNVAIMPSATTLYTVTGVDANGCSNTASVTVTVNPLPVVTASTSASTVCAGDMITLTGGGAVSYTWDNGVTDTTPFAATTSTVYTVTGTDANGCSNTNSVSVTVNPLPVVTASATPATVCAGEMVTLNGGGADTYTWDNGAVDNTAFVPAATTVYTVTGTDANGCMNTDMVTVTVNPLPVVTASASATTVCFGDMVTLMGGGATTYTWDNGVTDNTPFAATATTMYTVTGTDVNGCMDTEMITITVNPLPAVTASASATTVCAGEMVTLMGAGASTYTWDNGVTDNTPFAATTTTMYTVTGTDANGCMNTDMITINVNALPAVTAMSSASTVCAGDSVTVMGGGASTYVWDNGVTDNVAFAAMNTTTYMVTGTDANGCSNTATVTVTVNPLPTVVANASSTSVCPADSVILSGSGAVSYTWDNGVIDNMAFLPSGTMTYMVTGTDANGCMNTSTVTVTVNSNPVVTATASDNTVCAGDMVTLMGGGAATYTWDNGVTDNTPFAATTTTTYNVTGTDVNGCQGTAATTVTVNALPMVTMAAFNPDTICFQTPGFTLTSGSPAGGVYSGPGVITGMFNPSAAGLGVFTVTYTYTDANSCSNTASSNVTIEDCTGISEASAENSVSVYPNPTSGMFTLVYDNASFTEIRINIVDLQGKLVYSSLDQNNSVQFNKQIALDGIAKGIYYIKLETGSSVTMKKLIVQ
jgi:subtilisin-like proprotein convertase family protein